MSRGRVIIITPSMPHLAILPPTVAPAAPVDSSPHHPPWRLTTDYAAKHRPVPTVDGGISRGGTTFDAPLLARGRVRTRSGRSRELALVLVRALGLGPTTHPLSATTVERQELRVMVKVRVRVRIGLVEGIYTLLLLQGKSWFVIF